MSYLSYFFDFFFLGTPYFHVNVKKVQAFFFFGILLVGQMTLFKESNSSLASAAVGTRSFVS